MAESALERAMAYQMRVSGLPLPSREYRFDPVRRWRFDFAWPERRVALEVEGGVWTGGRHCRPRGFQGDAEKYNAATLAGWSVLRVTADDVRSGRALDVISKRLNQEKSE